jgi:hypothetical protein
LAGSSAEREIRDHAAARLRAMLPGARIIHELVVGGCRVDMAAVESERVTLVEIKSERDTLKRLPEQVRQFERAAHHTIVIAHERWWDRTPYANGSPRFVPSEDLRDGSGLADVWSYPEPERDPAQPWRFGAWHLSPCRFERPQPHAARLLELCWRAELAEEAFRCRIACSSRVTMPALIREMAWHMTGKEIAQAVCRQLRARAFPEADAPIIERLAA